MKRELEGGWFQWVTLPLPALLTIQSGINQLRYATLKGIMAAKKKEIRKVAPGATGDAPLQRILRVSIPEKSKKTQMIAGIVGGRGQSAGGEAARRGEGSVAAASRGHGFITMGTMDTMSTIGTQWKARSSCHRVHRERSRVVVIEAVSS